MLVFAHRGGRSLSWENTLRAFRLALAAGAGGLESDVRITVDGVPVLAHGARTITGMHVASRTHAQLPPWVPSLADLYAMCGTDFELSLDVQDDAAVPAVLEVARAAGAQSRLWLVASSCAAAATWRREHDGDFRLAHSVKNLPADLTGHVARLRDSGIDVLNARAKAWDRRSVETCHDAGVLAFGWKVLSRRRLQQAQAAGCDGIYTDWPRLYGQPVRATT